MIASTRVVPLWCFESGFERPAVAFLVFFSSPAVGVGSSFEIAVRRSAPPSPWLPGPFASDTVGVGNVCTTAGRSSPYPGPLSSRALAVSSNAEPPVPSVGGADVGGSNAAPPEVVTVSGHLIRDDVDPGSSSKDCWDVLHDNETGSKNANGSPTIEEQATTSPFADTGTTTGSGDVLARKPEAHHLDRLHAPPVGRGDIPVVRHPEPLGEHHGGVRVDLGLPHRRQSGDRFDGEVETADTGAERTDPAAHVPSPFSPSTGDATSAALNSAASRSWSG